MPDEAPATIADAYKSAFRGHPAGVAVITAEGPDGPTGLTASSVASVAVDPPVLVFSLSTNSGSAGVVLGAPLFVVHGRRGRVPSGRDGRASCGAPLVAVHLPR